MQIELQNMLDAINTDRSARGVAPLDVTLPEASVMSRQTIQTFVVDHAGETGSSNQAMS